MCSGANFSLPSKCSRTAPASQPIRCSTRTYRDLVACSLARSLWLPTDIYLRSDWLLGFICDTQCARFSSEMLPYDLPYDKLYSIVYLIRDPGYKCPVASRLGISSNPGRQISIPIVTSNELTTFLEKGE